MRALYEELRLRRKHARMIATGLSVGLLLIACLVFIVLESLPSTNQLRARYFSSRLHRPLNATLTAASPTQTRDTFSGMTIPVTPTPAPTLSQAPTVSLADYATERFIDRSDRALRVCDQLTTLSGTPPVDVTSFSRSLQDEISGQQNPYADAALAPLGAVLQIPTVAAVVTEIRNAQDSGDASLLRRAEFYSNVGFAASDVYSNNAAIDRVSDHAYHLSVLSRIAAAVPGSAATADFQTLCTAVQERTLTPSLMTPEQDAQEKSALLQLIASAGLTPELAGFDPSLSTQVTVSITPMQVQITTPWMSKMFGSGLQLSANP